VNSAGHFKLAIVFVVPHAVSLMATAAMPPPEGMQLMVPMPVDINLFSLGLEEPATLFKMATANVVLVVVSLMKSQPLLVMPALALLLAVLEEAVEFASPSKRAIALETIVVSHTHLNRSTII